MSHTSADTCITMSEERVSSSQKMLANSSIETDCRNPVAGDHNEDNPFLSYLSRPTGQESTSEYALPGAAEADEKPHKCDICGSAFRYPSLLERHSRIHTGEKPFECEICKKCYPHAGSLQKHMLAHNGNRPYTCEKCGANFAQSGHLSQHERMHSGEKPYTCTTCGKSFSMKANLTRHRRLHTGETPYTCKVCKETFSQISKLKRHEVRTHNMACKFKCEVCGKTFSDKTGLTLHNRVHVKAPSIVCSMCGKTLTQPGQLNQPEIEHLNGHTCYQCLQSNSGPQGSNLLIHNEERAQNCPLSSRNFKDSAALKDHLRVHVKDFGIEKVEDAFKSLNENVANDVAYADNNARTFTQDDRETSPFDTRMKLDHKANNNNIAEISDVSDPVKIRDTGDSNKLNGSSNFSAEALLMLQLLCPDYSDPLRMLNDKDSMLKDSDTLDEINRSKMRSSESNQSSKKKTLSADLSDTAARRNSSFELQVSSEKEGKALIINNSSCSVEMADPNGLKKVSTKDGCCDPGNTTKGSENAKKVSMLEKMYFECDVSMEKSQSKMKVNAKEVASLSDPVKKKIFSKKSSSAKSLPASDFEKIRVLEPVQKNLCTKVPARHNPVSSRKETDETKISNNGSSNVTVKSEPLDMNEYTEKELGVKYECEINTTVCHFQNICDSFQDSDKVSVNQETVIAAHSSQGSCTGYLDNDRVSVKQETVNTKCQSQDGCHSSLGCNKVSAKEDTTIAAYIFQSFQDHDKVSVKQETDIVDCPSQDRYHQLQISQDNIKQEETVQKERLSIKLEPADKNNGTLDGQTYVCGMCYLCFLDSDELDIHLNTHLESEIASVTIAKSEDDNHLTAPVIKTSSLLPLPSSSEDLLNVSCKNLHHCQFCKRTFVSARNLRRHIAVHNKKLSLDYDVHKDDAYFRDSSEKSDQCQTCKKKFANTRNLNKHMAVVHSKEPVVRNDDACSTEESPKCQSCKKEFANTRNLNRHTAVVHNKTSPHVCSVCNIHFPDNCKLKIHMLSHSGEKEFICEICHKKFDTIYHLKEHERVHTGDRPFSCSHCEKRFSLKGNLNQHERTHTGIKPYSCTVCSKAFGGSGDLSKHMRIHSGDRPYKCEKCGKGFMESGHLKRHEQTHNVSFQCRECKEMFRTYNALHCHLKKAHKDF